MLHLGRWGRRGPPVVVVHVFIRQGCCLQTMDAGLLAYGTCPLRLLLLHVSLELWRCEGSV